MAGLGIAAERVRAFVDRWTAPGWLGRDNLLRIDEHELTLADLRAVLDEREQLAARVAELETPGPVKVGTGMPATSHLEAFGQTLREAFGTMPYHVGSSIRGKVWRDVDVRIMLDDDRFDALFPGYATWNQRDSWWNLLCSGISELGRRRTGLPIDFQVQRTTEANEKFPGPRNPLFLPHAEDEHRPEMRIAARGIEDSAPDAVGTGLSATETPAHGVPVSADERTGVRPAAEPTEVRDQSAWCWAPNPNGPLHCGRLAHHSGPHKRGEREWWDNASQDAAKETGR